MKMLVTGADGNVGSYVPDVLGKDYDLVLTDVSTWDIRVMPDWVRDRPDVILHLAAATDVDACEQNPEWAHAVNALGTMNVAKVAASMGAFLVYVSTAGVFSGTKIDPYDETDIAIPANEYGLSKLWGEWEVERTLPSDQFAIVRAGWMYGGPNDKKFVAKMRDQIEAGADTLYAVDDKVGSPTYAKDLVALIGRLLKAEATGLFHGAGGGVASRFEVAQRVARRYPDVEVIPASSDRFPLPAPRADNESMVSLNLPLVGVEPCRPWEDALAEYLG